MLSSEEKIFIAGHRGMVGSAIVRYLQRLGFKNLITRSHEELDLTDQAAVRAFFQSEKIDRIVLAAAKVGGIHANNTYPAEFIYKNLTIECNVIHEAYAAGIFDLLFLGSSCIYPKLCHQPMKEEYLLSGPLEPTNEPYAIAKIAGIKMCQAYNRQYGTRYRAVMPTNIYGPGDNYHLENSHVIPAMLRKYHLAKLAEQGDIEGIKKDEKLYGNITSDIAKSIGYCAQKRALDKKHTPMVILWGTGLPRREFLHADDLASACYHVMDLEQNCFLDDNPPFLNVGAGKDITIREIAELIAELVCFKGKTVFNPDQPDGTPKKLLDIERITSLGWKPHFSLWEGLKDAYTAYLQQF